MADSVAQALSQLSRVQRLRKLRDERLAFSKAAARRQAAHLRVVPPLQEFVPETTPEYSAPVHLEPLTRKLEEAAQRPIRLCVSVPPRHGKSDTIFHWIAWLLIQEPRLRIAYIGYAAEFAEKQLAKCRKVCARAGVQFGAVDRADYWETSEGGSVTAQGAQGQLTGLGFHIIVVDDPHKNRQEAESRTIRQRIIDGFEDDIETREEPTGTSIVVVHTRWHPEDLIGHLTGKRGWELINLPAINDNGEALAPHLWTVEALSKHRRNKYKWESLYQGRPRPRGSEVFRGVTYCRLADIEAIRASAAASIGVDLAYTAKTRADKSISLALLKHGVDADGDPLFYVAEVERRQCEAPEFVPVLRAQSKRYPRARMRWYASGTEKGSGDFIKREVRKLEVEPATADKFVRATPASEAWNEGRILVPEDAEWAEDFVEVIIHFTGVNDAEDDDVDALAAAYDLHDAPRRQKVRSVSVRGI